MWGTNSISQRYQSNNKIIFDGNKNYPINNSYYNNNQSEINLLYQTPIKQFENIQNNNNNINITPFRFDFNNYFGNLWSSGKIPNNNNLPQQIILSPSQMKDNETLQQFKQTVFDKLKNAKIPINDLSDIEFIKGVDVDGVCYIND